MVRFGFILNLDRCVGCHTCTLVCRVWTYNKKEDCWNTVLEFNSHEEKRVVWIPYVCTQVREPACTEASKPPPCVRNCPCGARIYGDLDSPTDPAGRLVAEGKAKPLPYETDKPRVYYFGKIPGDVENQLPKPLEVLPRKYMPLMHVPP
jgi:Fe-S-cluster-containing dehydrogenase component